MPEGIRSLNETLGLNAPIIDAEKGVLDLRPTPETIEKIRLLEQNWAMAATQSRTILFD